MVRFLIRNFVLFFLFSGFLSCEEILTVDIVGDGNVKNEVRRPSFFDKIQLASSGFEVTLRSGEERRIIVETDSNILPYVTTIVSGNQLIVGTKINFKLHPREGVAIVIYYPEKGLEAEAVNGGILKTDSLILDRLEASVYGKSKMKSDTLELKTMKLFSEGSSNVELNGFFENLDVHQLGSGNISISGKSVLADFLLEGSGKIDSRQMLIDNADVRVLGSGLILCRVALELNASIIGSGRVYYYGIPERLEKEIEGEGLVLPGD